ncbi:MAG: hypothetical protein AAB615_03400 [Patescibacteria group bacterium]
MRILSRNNFSLNQSWVRTFLVTLFFVTLASGLFWLDFFRAYRAETTIVVIGKGSLTASSDTVASNIAEIASTLRFYDRMVQDSEEVADAFSDLSPDQRKKRFQNIFSATHTPEESGVIVLSAFGSDRGSAEALATAGSETLFALSSFYYNIKTDVDLRVLEGPIVTTTVRSPLVFVLLSFFSALGVTGIFFLILHFLPSLFGKKQANRFTPVATQSQVSHKAFSAGESVPWIDPRTFIPVKPENLSFENAEPIVPESVSLGAHPVKKAGAPANLPVAESLSNLPFATEDTLPFAFEEVKDEEEVLPVTEDVPTEMVVSEPTVEEYKKRLNELLGGKM